MTSPILRILSLAMLLLAASSISAQERAITIDDLLASEVRRKSPGQP